MNDNSTSNESDSAADYDDEILIPSAEVQFWTYLVFEIPSIFCTIYLLLHLIFDRHLRRHLHNHVIIILLFLCLVILIVDNSFYLDGWRTGHGNSFTSSANICLLWWFIDYGFYGAISVFLVWASFERHLLVFHRRRFLTSPQKIFYIHYLPLFILSIYLLGFYIGVIVRPPCENIFDFHQLACGSYPCYQDISWLNAWDYLMNGVLCNLFEAIFSSALVFRSIRKKFTARGQLHWKKYRKMTLQLLSISTLSLCINLPQSLIILVRQIQPGMSDFGSAIEPYLFYLTGYLVLLLPFVYLGFTPDLWPKILCCKHKRRIGPETITIG